MPIVKGVVTGIGDKYNGSVKVNDKWYSFKKGIANKAKEGDSVEITLTPWAFKDKTGENITAIEVMEQPKRAERSEAPRQAVSGGRDLDKEARGKTLCQYVAAQLSNPSVDVSDTTSLFERAVDLMKRTFEA